MYLVMYQVALPGKPTFDCVGGNNVGYGCDNVTQARLIGEASHVCANGLVSESAPVPTINGLHASVRTLGAPADWHLHQPTGVVQSHPPQPPKNKATCYTGCTIGN
jgi:hypothetical protein